jgi:phosphoglycerate kinase
VADDDMIFDIGPKHAGTGRHHHEGRHRGVERPGRRLRVRPVRRRHEGIAAAIAATKAFTLAGGGDTIAAIQKYGIYDKVSYISTAGGAFLEFLEGKTSAGRGYPRTAGGDDRHAQALNQDRRHPRPGQLQSPEQC